MPYITKVDLARNAKLFSGDTSNLGGSIKLGEDLTVEGNVVFTGVNAYTGSTYTILVSDELGKVSKKDVGDISGGMLALYKIDGGNSTGLTFHPSEQI